MATTRRKTEDVEATAEPVVDTSPGEGSTTLDSDLTKPSETAPGDGPADTVDPTELASSATPDKAAAVQAGAGTVNAVVKSGSTRRKTAAKASTRTEKYTATKPDGTVVTVERDIDTGASKVLDEDD
jgi:hypothetical protein